jgi:PAS domain S-box-containing protein
MSEKLATDAMLGGILDTLPGGVALVDSTRHVLYLNRTLAAWCRIDPAAACGRTLSNILPPAPGRDSLGEALEHALRGSGSRHHLELSFADGATRWSRVDFVPQRAADGTVRGCSVTISDLGQADVPEAVAAILAGERAFADALIDSVPAIVLLLSPDGTIQRVSRYFEELTGYRLDEIRGKDWCATFLPERVHAEIQSVLTTSLAGKSTRGHINPILLRDGRERLIEWSDTVIEDGTGRVVSLLAVGHDITDLLNTQNALRRSEQIMGEIARLSHVGLFNHDHVTGEIYWSPEQRSIFGWDMTEPIAVEKLLTQIHPDDRARVEAAIRRAHDPAGDGRFDVEYRIICRDGSIRWVDNRSQTYFEGAGPGRRPVRTIGATIDVTIRKETEEALRKSESRLRQAQSIARLGNWELDLQTNHLWWSDEVFRIFEIDSEKFAASYEAFLELIHPEDRQLTHRAYTESIANRMPYQITHRLLMPDGRLKWVEERCQTTYDGNGRPLVSSGTIQDITDQHRAEEALREREKLLRQGARIGRFGAWVWDVSADRCLVCSEELAALFSMTVEEFMREKNSDRKIRFDPLPEYRPENDERDLPEEGRPFEEEFRALTKNGELRWFREAGHVYRNLSTGKLWSVGITQDITDSKNNESELRRLIEESARLARLAEQSNQAKSEFLATMSHELRTPLNAIIGFSELLMAFGPNLDTGKQDEYHGIILQSGRHLLSLINDILDLAKVESGRLELRPVDISLSGIAAECVSYLEPAAQPKGLSIEVDMPPLVFRSDRRLLKQLLLNILSNAVKFNREGGWIGLRAALEPDGEHIVISVADTGIGMTEDEIGRALQPFAQIETTYSRTTEGTGLGLTLVQRFTAILGGTFDITSQRDVGTTVTLRLPLVREPVPA